MFVACRILDQGEKRRIGLCCRSMLLVWRMHVIAGAKMLRLGGAVLWTDAGRESFWWYLLLNNKQY